MDNLDSKNLAKCKTYLQIITIQLGALIGFLFTAWLLR